MKFKEFSFVVYSVKDVKKSRAFYEKILGLKPVSIYEDDNFTYVEYEVGQDTLAISKGAASFRPGKTGATVALELVGNFDQMVEKLEQKKVKIIRKKHESPVCTFVIVADPSGNQIMLHKRKNKK